MGIFTFFAIINYKKQVKRYIEVLNNESSELRAEWIFYVWLTSGINLMLVGNNVENLINTCKQNGIPIPNLPISDYKKGSEVGIIDYKNECSVKHSSYINAINMHLYTSVAASYSGKKDYCDYVKEMWNLLLSDYSDLREMKLELSAWFENPEIIKIIENNHVTVENLIKNPDVIFPEFLKIR